MKNKILLMNISAAVVLCLILACGKMGDPRPRLPHGDNTMARLEAVDVSDLILSSSQEGILLTWDVSGDASVAKKIRIYRSDFNLNDGDCQDCPPLRKNIIEELSLEELKRNIRSDGRYVYEDRGVQGGFIYKYSLQLCADQDICRNPFPETAISFRPEGKKSDSESGSE